MAQTTGIPLDYLIQTTSTGIKDSFSNSKLNTLLIVKYDANNPMETFTSFSNVDAVSKALPNIINFANIYFGFTSKQATKAELLTILSWNTKATASSLIGNRLGSLDVYQKINGAFTITFGTNKLNVNLDLSNETLNSYSDLATKLQTAIRQTATTAKAKDGQQAVVLFNSNNSNLIIQTGSTGSTANISFLGAPTAGTDISNIFGLMQNQGAYIVSGKDAIPTLQDLLNLIKITNGNYFNITTNFVFDDEEKDLITFGSWLKNSNGRYLGIYSMSNLAIVSTNDALQNYFAYDGLMIDYALNPNQNAFLSAIISAIDFSNTNGNYNIAFNEAKIFANSVTKEADLINLNANRANSVLTYGKLGQFSQFYGMGKIMGELTDSANIYIADSYLTIALQFALANMFLSQGFIGVRGTNNISMIFSYINPIFDEAVVAGIIVQGSELTTTEKNIVISNFRNQDNALQLLQTRGYYYELSKIDTTNKTIEIVRAYVANTPINKIVIRNYILGA